MSGGDQEGGIVGRGSVKIEEVIGGLEEGFKCLRALYFPTPGSAIQRFAIPDPIEVVIDESSRRLARASQRPVVGKHKIQAAANRAEPSVE
jgi:hypothetical protein